MSTAVRGRIAVSSRPKKGADDKDVKAAVAPADKRRSVDDAKKVSKPKAAAAPAAGLPKTPDLPVGTTVTVVSMGRGTVMFCGTTTPGKGEWIGVALDAPNGKNDGTLNGYTYFKCKPNHGVFVRRSQISVQLLEDPSEDGKDEHVGPGIPRGGYMVPVKEVPIPLRRKMSSASLSSASSLGKPSSPPLATTPPLVCSLPSQILPAKLDLRVTPQMLPSTRLRIKSAGSTATDTEEAESMGTVSPTTSVTALPPSTANSNLHLEDAVTPQLPTPLVYPSNDEQCGKIAERSPQVQSPKPSASDDTEENQKEGGVVQQVDHQLNSAEQLLSPVKSVTPPPPKPVVLTTVGPPPLATPMEAEVWWNEKWREMCQESGDMACRAIADGCNAQARCDAMDKLWASYKATMEQFEKGCSYKEQVSPSREQLMKEMHQHIPFNELADASAKPNLVPLDKLLQKLREMKTRPNSDLWCEALDEGIDLLKKAEGCVRSGRLNSQDWADIVTPLINLLSDHMNTPEVSENLMKSNEELKRAMFTVEEIAHAQQEAIMEGDVIQAEDLYYSKIDSQEAVTKLLMNQIDILSELHAAMVESQLRRINQVHNRANANFSDRLKAQQKQKERLQHEVEALEAEAAAFRTRMQQTEEAYEQLYLKSAGQIKEKANQQQALWDQIAAAEAELVRLAKEQVDTAERQLNLVSDRRREMVEEKQRITFIEERSEALDLTLRRIAISEELFDTMEEFVGNACRAMEHRTQAVDKQIEELKLDIHRKHLQGFRTLYLTLGELTYRKEQNALEVEKKIEMARVQQELLMDSLNPAAKEAADRRKQLCKVKEEMMDKLGALNERANSFEQHFRITEQALITAGETFLHPKEELQKVNENRQLKILEYHKLGASEIAEGEELVAAMELTLKNPAINKILSTPVAGSARRLEPFRVRPREDDD